MVTMSGFFRSLKKNIPLLESYLGGAEMKIAFKDLKNNYSWSYKGNNPGWAASLIKVPVMMSVFEKVNEGELHLDDKLIVTHDFVLEPTDPVTRLAEGTPVTVLELLTYMIVKSDNEATNMLVHHLELFPLNESIAGFSTRNTMMGHLIGQKEPRHKTAWNPDGSNLTTVNDMAMLLEKIYSGKAVNADASQLMRTLLEIKKHSPIRQYLPRNTTVGCKIGQISDPDAGDDYHEVGVVNGDYVLGVMCNKIGKDDHYRDWTSSYIRCEFADDIISDISARVFEAYYS